MLVVALLGVVAVVFAAAQPSGAQDPQAGEKVYKLQCAKCHGESGAGDGKEAAKLKEKPHDWTAGKGDLKAMDDAKMFEIISKGGPAVGKARTMPAYPKLSEGDIKNVMAFIKTFRK
jgi:cytochrome c oxidase cbb3-type subunit 3